MKTALIDTDGLIYAAAAASEVSIEWEPDVWTIAGDLDQAKRAFETKLATVLDKTAKVFSHDNHILCLTDSGHDFRRDIWPAYKAKRGRKPVDYKPLREWVLEKYAKRVYLRPKLEADDILGILATHPTLVKGTKVCVSIDKDLKQIPGLNFNPDKDEGLQQITPEEGALWHLVQTLTGDQTDGYPGCPSIGAKRAPAVAAGGWPAVVEAFEKQGLTEDDALVQARVAKILTADLYDFDKKQRILWSPN